MGDNRILKKLLLDKLNIPYIRNMSTANMSDLIGDKKMMIDLSYTLSHLIVETLLVICLKKFNSILLAVLLSLILSYICYIEQTNIPIYMLPTFAIILYILDSTIMRSDKDVGCSNTFWKLPYFGILVYYIRML
jgi:hypothetical protein